MTSREGFLKFCEGKAVVKLWGTAGMTSQVVFTQNAKEKTYSLRVFSTFLLLNTSLNAQIIQLKLFSPL